MRSNYKKVGDFIKQSKLKNDDGRITRLLGVNLDKEFMPSVANLNGVDLTSYKIIKRGQFGCKLMSVGRDSKVPIARLVDYDEALISSAYFVFEVKDETILNPEYLMMWFSRSESDRFQWFQSGGDIRGRITWDEFGNLPIKVPSIKIQQKIVNEYHTITNRIELNEQLNQKLEETAQALYKHWFIDFEFPNDQGEPYKSSGGAMVYNEELDREIPGSWMIGNLGSYINVINGFAFKSSDFEFIGRTHIIKIKNITKPTVSLTDCQYYNDDITKRLEKVKVGKGDILISMTGSGANQMNSAVGQVGRYYHNEISLINQRVGKIEMLKNRKSEFIYQFIKDEDTHMELLNGSTGSANQANISPEQIKNLRIIMPKDDILDKFQSLAKVMFNAKRVSNQDVFIEMKDLLLSKMATVGSEEEIVTN